MSSTDAALMQLIKDQYDATIRQTAAASSVPPAFLAALTANESGGNPGASRFEPGVLNSLWSVVMNRKPAFGSIQRAALLTYLDEEADKISFTDLDNLATSWGLTQIMGYNALDLGTTVGALQTASGNLTAAIKLLTQFAHRFNLELDADAADLFRCWNTGQPNGKTFDPDYVTNGLARMQIYEGIVQT